MNSLLSEDQAALEDFCQKLLAKEWPVEKALKVLGPNGSGHSPELWKVLVEAGWLGMPFDPELGGAGGDLIDLGLIYRAAGERLVPGSFYACVFASLLIAKLGTDVQKKDLLSKIISGDTMATVAFSEPQATENPKYFTTTASRTADGWSLKGTKAFIANLDIADVLLVLARTRSNGDRNGWGVFAVDAKALREQGTRYATLGGEALFQLTLDKVAVPAGALLGGEAAIPTTLDDFDDVVEQATALQCMEMVGGITEIMKRTVDYVGERRQGGRQIGSYQAVQHLMANVRIQLQGGSVAALNAIFQKSKGRPAAKAISIAKVALGEAYSNATITAQQLWGSMGYARESGVYMWSERAKVSDAWLGTRATHLRRVAEHMGL